MSIEIPSRRNFITGLAAVVAAPAIVRVSSLMPVKMIICEMPSYGASPVLQCLAALSEYQEKIRATLQLPDYVFGDTVTFGRATWIVRAAK